MSDSDSTKNWEHRPGAQVNVGSSAFLETAAELLIIVKSEPIRRMKGKLWHVEQISLNGADGYPVTSTTRYFVKNDNVIYNVIFLIDIGHEIVMTSWNVTDYGGSHLGFKMHFRLSNCLGLWC